MRSCLRNWGGRQSGLKVDSIHDRLSFVMTWCGRPSGALGDSPRARAPRCVVLLSLVCVAFGVVAPVAVSAGAQAKSGAASSSRAPKAGRVVTEGMVTVEGRTIKYTATAGTIILRSGQGKPTGSMFYVAYVKRGIGDESRRPITFIYNGGPGSSSIWLHMGAFGPVRIVTGDHGLTPAAPYKLVNNDYSLLDATDEVFIDAISTGYSRILRKDQGGVGTRKNFDGVDPDVKSFAQFIMRYLSTNNRWNSPKYLYGESYGTLRSEVLANWLEQEDNIDLNGVILQSSYVGSFVPPLTPGSDTRYEIALPTMAADAWYHHKLPRQPAALQPFLQEVERFAMGPYAVALNAGNTLDPHEFAAIATKLHEYTGLSAAYIEKADLRVEWGEFLHELSNGQDQTIGLLDGRFAGPSMDPMAESAEYDPQQAAIASAYFAGFNYYVHNVLKYGRGQVYRVETSLVFPWSRRGKNLVTGKEMFAENGGVDLAQAMKYDPRLQVLVSCGYFDFSTPFYGMIYSINHLRIPRDLQPHIHVDFYRSGHMIYVHVPSLKKLHDNTARFIKLTENAS